MAYWDCLRAYKNNFDSMLQSIRFLFYSIDYLKGG